MFKKSKGKAHTKKDMLFDKLVEQFECTEPEARRFLNAVPLDTVEHILNSNIEHLERDYVRDELKVDKASEQLKRNKKFQEALETITVLRGGHNHAMKKYKEANKLRMKCLDMRCSDE